MSDNLSDEKIEEIRAVVLRAVASTPPETLRWVRALHDQFFFPDRMAESPTPWKTSCFNF